MEIKKSSWHYRLISSFGDDIPKNLCGYFQRLVLCITGVLFVISVLGFFLFILIIGPFLNHESYFFRASVSTWVLVGIMCGLYGIIYLILRVVKFLVNKKQIEKKPNLITSYWKAFKNKVCPQITFT